MSEQNARKLGFTDAAATKDQFEITDYIGGLATFIEECNTPMTISIQGSWGTGKTSIMNLVNNSLTKDDSGKELVNSKVKTIWFNTWQFSQFDMDEQLATSLRNLYFYIQPQYKIRLNGQNVTIIFVGYSFNFSS